MKNSASEDDSSQEVSSTQTRRGAAAVCRLSLLTGGVSKRDCLEVGAFGGRHVGRGGTQASGSETHLAFPCSSPTVQLSRTSRGASLIEEAQAPSQVSLAACSSPVRLPDLLSLPDPETASH